MNKADGQLVAIKFTEDIIHDPSTPIGEQYSQIKHATITALNYYSAGYEPSLLNDGVASQSYYWRGAGSTNWIQVKYLIKKIVSKFRWYIASSSYYPTTFTISGSDDGITWTQLSDVLTGTGTIGWQEFPFSNTTAYLYYKIDILTSSSTRQYISELEFYCPFSNETAFTVTGKEYDSVPNGVLQDREYSVAKVEYHPTELKTILLTVYPNNRFESSVGMLTIAYDSTKGTLFGYGGPVASFSIDFSPLDLISKPDQNDQEHIEISNVSITCNLIRVYYTESKEDEHIEFSISATGVLTNINDL